MLGTVRILVAAALHGVARPLFETYVPGAVVTGAGTPDEVRRAVSGTVRYDVAVVDLCWSDAEYEFSFDGLDVIKLLADEDRHAPVVLALQGHSLEGSHLAEALTDPAVKAVHRKTDPPSSLARVVEAAAAGRSTGRAPTEILDRRPSIHEYFASGRRGHTAARLAAAIASGRTWNAESVATVACVPVNTANKVTSYLAPLLHERDEVPRDARVTAEVAYRWCGEHARYLLSWARRHLNLDLSRA